MVRVEGVAVLEVKAPHVKYVQFVDADCELKPDWLEEACKVLSEDPQLAAVFGHLEERQPHLSIYNLLCQLEWKGHPGLVSYFAGVALVRLEALLEVGGYNQTLIAGEEPELSVRLAAVGYQIRRIGGFI